MVEVAFEAYSFRQYGQPKLSKPKELIGIRQIASIPYIPQKCTCPMFINGNDVWIKHGDYFSPSLQTEEIGAPLEYLANKYADKQKGKKFIYSDAWGSIVLRQEAWLVVRGLVSAIASDSFTPRIVREICRQQEITHGFEELSLCCTDMERFWEKVINKIRVHHM